jgi:hypothetical protein
MSMPEVTPKSPARRWTVAAAVVAIIGLFILTVSSLCTGIAGFGMLAGVFDNPSSLSSNEWATLIGTLVTLALIGGVPMLIGFFIALLGFRMRKKE